MRRLRPLRSFPVALLLLGLAAGCATHTAPSITGTYRASEDYIIGIRSFYDVNGFNYADLVKNELERYGRGITVLLTHDIADPRCDYVIKGDFMFGRVKTRTGFFYSSIYLLYLPALTGIPVTYIDGQIDAHFEVLQGGKVLMPHPYTDVFREGRGLYSFNPTGTTPEAEVRRVTRQFLRDFCREYLN